MSAKITPAARSVLDYYEYAPRCWREKPFGTCSRMQPVCRKLRTAMFAGAVSIFGIYMAAIICRAFAA